MSTTTATTYTALLAPRCHDTSVPGPCWNLTVAVCPGRVSGWPGHTWPTGTTIPAIDERERALAALGFAISLGEGWTWTEDACQGHHGHPAHVTLFAAAPLRPLGGGAA